MNAFVEHHKNNIQFEYRCFDRLLLNGLIQPFQQPERVLGFFNTYRDGKRVTRRTLTEIADQFQYWLKNRSEKWGAPILEPPDGSGDDSRRDKFIDPYFENAKPNQVVAILKAREPARILVAIGDKNNDSPHLEYKQRWVNQFNFYLNDPHWGRMFVRMCPYFCWRFGCGNVTTSSSIAGPRWMNLPSDCWTWIAPSDSPRRSP